MSEIDFSKLGLKCGIEIHQQLDTQHKLFCMCRSRFSEAKPLLEIARKLRVVAGETGEIDVAALGEVAKGTEFVYRVYPEESCLIELDDEPPGNMNSEALDIVLTVAEMLKCEVPEEIHVMRKTVLDGSNTSGFQRTSIAGLRGKMATSFGDVGIENVCLEEESCQIMGRDGNRVFYGLDRLGIPLVEIGTSPDIHTPEQAREVSEKLGMIVRSTEKVKRGLGTIRQDVNVSIANGARVEIKGAQELRMIPKFVENEALRQASLIEIKKELHKAGFKQVRPKVVHVSHIFKDSESKITKDKTTYAILIPDFAGYMKRALTPSRTLGNEIANYVRAKSEMKGIIHSDEELEKYKLTKDFEKLRHEMKAGPGDTLIIAVGEEKAVEKTMDIVSERINQLVIGVPKEVRKALDTGETEFMRPLPGAARLYPETDVPPIRITHVRLAEIRKNLPELLSEKEERHAKEIVHKFHISGEITKQVVKAGKKHIFDALVVTGADPKVIANTLVSTMPYLKRENVYIEKITEAHLAGLFDELAKGKLAKEAIPEVLKALAKEPSLSVEQALRKTKIVDLTIDDLKLIIIKTLDKNSELVGDERGENILLGLVMQQVRGKIDTTIVMSELRIAISKRKERK
ncbi:MAG: Glu-tRNA(Gln) amidotransferase subunit GatE [Candidatus Aenigmatarchaeota archaeon]